MNTAKKLLNIFVPTMAISIQALSVLSAAELPQQVQRLVDKRQEAINKIDVTFINELEKLKIIYTKAGDLENALLVDGMIKNNKDGSKITQFTIEGEWKLSYQGKIMTRRFVGNNMIDENGGSRPWVRENNKVKIYFADGWWEYLDIDPKNPDTMEGINNLNNKVTYTRAK